MNLFPQQQFAGLPAQCQQCILNPGYNNISPGYGQFPQQQQYSPFSSIYPQQYMNNPYQQQQQQQQFYYPPQQQQQFSFYPQQQQQYPGYPQQQQFSGYPQQQQFPGYPQQQQFPYYQQQQQQQWPQSNLGQNAYGYQQYWPQQQQRVFEDPSTPLPPVHRGKEKGKKVYERYYS